MSDRYGKFEMVNGCIANDLSDRVEELEAFIESITDVSGPYPEVNGTQLVNDAYNVLSPVLIPKNPPHRDRKYLDWLRDQPCFISGLKTHEYETVVPAHTGTSGRGSKAPDKHTLPMMQSWHMRSHSEGVVTFWTEIFRGNPKILDDLLSNYAENVYYKKYLRETK